MVLTWFLFTLTLAFCQGWVLEVNEKNVAKKLTNNVTLYCHDDGSDNEESPLGVVSRIRLLKFQSGNKWTTVAKVSDINPKVSTSLPGITTANGYAGVRNKSFLSIYFNTATDDIVGQFQCEVDGYDLDDELTIVKTDPVVISERGVSYDDILEIILKLKTEEKGSQASNENRLSDLESTMSKMNAQAASKSRVLSQLTNRVNLLSNDFLKVSDDLIRKQKQILANFNKLAHVSDLQTQAWPEGSYSLMKSTSGCPISNAWSWDESNVRINTQQGSSNKDNTSIPTHLTTPILQANGNANYFYMRFCSKKTTAAGPAWPKGKYCVQSYTATCPENLLAGYIQYDRENIGSYDTLTGTLAMYRNAEVTRIKYCCRNDGNASIPIILPNESPFYLYRFGGQCQEVLGMSVAREWISLDTKRTNDAYNNAFHPDGQIKNVKVELCYYTPN